MATAKSSIACSTRDHALSWSAWLALLARDGWTTIPEATFKVDGERGSIDILAWHEADAAPCS